MVNLKITTPVMLAVLISSGAALAQEAPSRFYGTVSGGWAFFDDIKDSGVKFGLDDDYTFGAALGYKFSMIRAELEVSYASTEFDSAKAFGVKVPASGDLDIWAGMINGFYDFDMGGDSAWVPSIGGGIGLSYGETNDVVIGGVSAADDDGTDFAWQVGGGLRYRFAGGMSVGADYRYFQVESNAGIELHKALITLGTSF